MKDEMKVLRRAAMETPELMAAFACILAYGEVFPDAGLGSDDEGQAYIHFNLLVPDCSAAPPRKQQYDWYRGRAYSDHVEYDLLQGSPSTACTEVASQQTMSLEDLASLAAFALVAWELRRA